MRILLDVYTPLVLVLAQLITELFKYTTGSQSTFFATRNHFYKTFKMSHLVSQRLIFESLLLRLWDSFWCCHQDMWSSLLMTQDQMILLLNYFRNQCLDFAKTFFQPNQDEDESLVIGSKA